MSADLHPPTIVGPRPEGDDSPGKDVPRGIEKVVALARISPYWRDRVLEDPLAAAEAARLELTENERAVLRSVPGTMIGEMAGSFERTMPKPIVLGGIAAGVAAAAAVGTAVGLGGSDAALSPGADGAGEPGAAEAQAPAPAASEISPAMLGLPLELSVTWICLLGSTADIPVRVEHTTPLRWAGSIPDALDEAKDNPRGVRCVFLGSTRAEGSTADVLNESTRNAISGAEFWNVNVFRPGKLEDGESPVRKKQLEREAAEYRACLKKYGIKKLPTVVYLAPNGQELARLEQPSAAGEAATIGEVRKKLSPMCFM